MHLFCRGLPNKYRLPNADIQTVFTLFLCISLKFNSFSPTFSSRFDESGGELLFFQKFFQKHPPRIVSHFKQVKGFLIFFSKYPPIFSLPGLNKWRDIKNFFEIGRFWVCISEPFVQMSERSFFYGKIIKEIKTGMGLLHQSQNRQKNIQRFVPQMSEWL